MKFKITPSLGGYVLRTETEWFLCESKAEAMALAQRERERIARESAEIEQWLSGHTKPTNQTNE